MVTWGPGQPGSHQSWGREGVPQGGQGALGKVGLAAPPELPCGRLPPPPPQVYMNAVWHGWAVPMFLFLAILRLSLNYLIAR